MAHDDVMTIGEALAALESRLFVGRQREIEQFRAWLVDRTSAPTVLNVSGPGGIGKSALVRALGRLAEAEGRTVRLVSGGEFRPTPGGLLRELGAETLDDAVRDLNERHAVLVLDTFEELTDLTPFLQDSLLPRLRTDVRVLIAGRHPLGQIWSRGPWHALIRPLALASFSQDESRQYLAQRGVDRPEAVEMMLRVAGGFPLALSLAADMAQYFGARDLTRAPEWRLAVHGLVERLMRDVTDPSLRELLGAAAVVRQFDESTLTAISGRGGAGDAFARLCRLSIVRPGEHGLMLHDDVRRILADDLRWRHGEKYAELRLRAAAHYRQRMQTASPAEREWLLTERLLLWENALVQTLAGGAGERGDVWVEVAGPEHLPDVLAVQRTWQTHVLPKLFPFAWTAEHDREADVQFIANVVSHAGTRTRIARDGDGLALGYSVMLPVSRETVGLLEANPTRATAIRALWGRTPRLPLPATAAESNILFIVNLATGDRRPEDARAALVRDILGAFALGGVYLVTTPLVSYQQLMLSLGFSAIPEARNTVWGSDYPTETLILDLRSTGIEPWIEAIMAGRRPPIPLAPHELEQAIQDALVGWPDDEDLAESVLVPRLLALEPTATVRDRAARLRDALHRALEQARQTAGSDDLLAFRALELAYLDRATTHDEVARQLAVSRSTFYRLVRRAIRALTQQLTAE